MLARGMANKAIQFYFNRQDRAVNSGRISGIKHRDYGPEVPKASDEALSAFIANFASPELSAPGIVVETTPAAPLDAMDEKMLRSFFAKDANGVWRCTAGETDEYECKEGFSLRNFSKPLRTIAGFANNRGGYLFFGVKDKPLGFAVSGLADGRFTDTDQNKFSQTIRSVLEPTPRFRVASLKLDAMTVGVIHVEPHSAKPVIASKTEGDVAEGAIYYRYSGETKAICYADLRAILDERDQRSREAILPMVQRLLELGPKDAMVANLADGQLEDGGRPILIDPQSLERIKFIREGEFDEVDGAPTLRVIGDAQTVPTEILAPVRTVREEVTVDAILRNFINRNPVEQPLSYFSQVSHEAGWILPIFYYLHLAGQSRKGAVAALKASKIAKPKTRDELIKLLNAKRTLYSRLGGHRGAAFNHIIHTRNISISTERQAKEVCSALTGMGESDRTSFDLFHDLLGASLAVWEASDGDRNLLGYIRRAASRLDELEYGALIE
ncbi:ATP-binding protein [Sphingopyxis sp. L1A2A]|uniref:AlbA family DNA-binding domain-containing protein n=1 Tax=Sphingopyxis sp. L1A2A TaxID=2502247 RepID=UPI0010F7011E|nr:ATP-binding protein [Sphingopyxis sp. L1A2A]